MKLLAFVLVGTAGLFAQAPDYSTNTSAAMALQKQVAGVITRSAEKMTEEDYNYKPTPDVRSFAAIVGHVADAQYSFCSAVLGEKSPGLNIEKTKTSKADLVAAVKAAFAYCDKAYAFVTEANGGDKVSFFGGQRARLSVLSFNTMHNFEHYGNLVTYMRMKGVVPPSSEPRK